MPKYKRHCNSDKSIGGSYFINSFLILFFILLCNFIVKADTNRISDIYIEASGANQYEAKIKANEIGRIRALYFLAGKMHIATDGLKKVPYDVMKSLFTIEDISNEESNDYHYSATVTYSYSRSVLHNVLLKYFNSDVRNSFYDAIIFPIFKQGYKLNIWGKEKYWNNIWGDLSGSLEDSKIYYPKKTEFLASQITENNILSLQYSDFLNIFPNKLFKDVIIITSEFFISKTQDLTTLRIRKYVITPDNVKENLVTEEYYIKSRSEIQEKIESIINKVIHDYGSPKLARQKSNLVSTSEVVGNPVKKSIDMKFEASDKLGIEFITLKLYKVTQIEKFIVNQDDPLKYTISIFSLSTEYNLAESLYLNGLSYNIRNGAYYLIDIKNGG